MFLVIWYLPVLNYTNLFIIRVDTPIFHYMPQNLDLIGGQYGLLAVKPADRRRSRMSFRCIKYESQFVSKIIRSSNNDAAYLWAPFSTLSIRRWAVAELVRRPIGRVRYLKLPNGV